MQRKNVFCKAGILLLSLLLLPEMMGCGAVSSLIATPTLTPTLTLTAIPTSTLTPTPSFSDILTAVAAVADGEGIPVAGEYDPEDPGPHRFVILHASGRPHDWNQSIPRDWRPSTIGEVELVILVHPEVERALDTQRYYYPDGRSAPSITRYYFETVIEIRIARSGDNLCSQKLTGSDPAPFPLEAPVDQVRIDGGHVTYSDVEAFLRQCLAEPGTFPIRILRSPWLLEYEHEVADAFSFSPDGQIIAAAYSHGIVLWQIGDGKQLATIRWPGSETASTILFSHDGQFLVASMGWPLGDRVMLWEVPTASLLRTIELPDEYKVWAITFSSDDQSLVVFANGRNIYDWPRLYLWRIEDGEQMCQLTNNHQTWPNLQFLPDPQFFVAGQNLWRLSGCSAQIVRQLVHDRSGAVYSHDGRYFLLPRHNCGRTQLDFSIWRAEDEQMLQCFQPDVEIFDIALSPDGQIVAFIVPTAIQDGVWRDVEDTIQVWNVDSGVLLYTFRGMPQLGGVHSNREPKLEGLQFSPDGGLLASISGEAVLLWAIPEEP